MAPLFQRQTTPIVVECPSDSTDASILALLGRVDDSTLSVTANVIGVLTFVAAIILSIQIRLVASRHTLEELIELKAKIETRKSSCGMENQRLLDELVSILRDENQTVSTTFPGVGSHARRLSIDPKTRVRRKKSSRLDSDDSDDDDEIVHLVSTNEHWKLLYKSIKKLVKEMKSFLYFGVAIHRPLLWVMFRRGKWAHDHLERFRSRYEMQMMRWNFEER